MCRFHFLPSRPADQPRTEVCPLNDHSQLIFEFASEAQCPVLHSLETQQRIVLQHHESSQLMLYNQNSELVAYRYPQFCDLAQSPANQVCSIDAEDSQLVLYSHFADSCSPTESPAKRVCSLHDRQQVMIYHHPDVCSLADSPSSLTCPLPTLGSQLMQFRYHSGEICTPSSLQCTTTSKPPVCQFKAADQCTFGDKPLDGFKDMCPANWRPVDQCSPADEVEDTCPIRMDDYGEICLLRDEDTSSEMCPVRIDDSQSMCPLRTEDYGQCALLTLSEGWWLDEAYNFKCSLGDKPGTCLIRDRQPTPFNSSTQCALADISGYEQNLTCQSEFDQTEFVGAAVLLIGALALLYLYWRKRKRVRLPPGPFSWPVVGHLHRLGAHPHQFFYRLSNKYGPLMYLHLGSVPTVVISSSIMAREFLRTHDQIFATRPVTAAGQHLAYNRSGLVWAPFGPHWQKMRKVCMELMGPDQPKFFHRIMIEETGTVIRSFWDALYDEEDQLDVSMKVSAMVNNIFSRLVLGQKYYGKGTEGRVEAFEYKLLMGELSHLCRAFNVGDYIPFLKWMDIQGYDRRMKKVMKRLDVFLEEIIEEHCQPRAGSKNRGGENFLDILLSIPQNSQSFQVELNHVEIKALIVDLLTGAINATAATIEWAMSELLRNPVVMKKAQDELDKVVGKERRLEISDLTHLQYLQAIVKEILRLHPVCPLAIAHESTEACKVEGFYIPKEARLFVNLWAMGQDVTAWIRPSEFFPERFLIETEIDVQGQHFQLVPFGSGSRMCPGMPQALSVVQFALVSLIHCFDWSLPSKQKPENLDMEESLELVISRATPLIAVPRARLPPHLF